MPSWATRNEPEGPPLLEAFEVPAAPLATGGATLTGSGVTVMLALGSGALALVPPPATGVNAAVSRLPTTPAAKLAAAAPTSPAAAATAFSLDGADIAN